MAIKINGQDLKKRFINGQEIFRVYKTGVQVRPDTVPPVFDDYLCFTANTAGSTISLNYGTGSETHLPGGNKGFEISYDKSTWVSYHIGSSGGDVITLSNIGDKVYFRSSSENPVPLSEAGTYFYHFSMSGSIAASGDTNSLLCKNGSASLVGTNNFRKLFINCTALTSAPSLSATTATGYCYQGMFLGCTNLTTAPSLPATTVDAHCYESMFDGCTNLTTAPSLPATILADYCYAGMFSGCSSLSTSPALPATSLGTYCYYVMFNGCSSLNTLPILPATTLKTACYAWMFANCSRIRLSETQSAIFVTPYRIPSSGTGVDAASSMGQMFRNTGGTFTGAPAINTTYYTNNAIIS